MTRRTVNATPAREHVRHLIERKMRHRDIATAAGMSPAALSVLINGTFAPGRPPKEHITAELATRILAVEYTPRPIRTSNPATVWCPRTTDYQPAGYRTGRCPDCGELTQLQNRDGQTTLIPHPTLDPLDGDDL